MKRERGERQRIRKGEREREKERVRARTGGGEIETVRTHSNVLDITTIVIHTLMYYIHTH